MRPFLLLSVLTALICWGMGCGIYVVRKKTITFVGIKSEEVGKRCDPFLWRKGW